VLFISHAKILPDKNPTSYPYYRVKPPTHIEDRIREGRGINGGRGVKQPFLESFGSFTT